jgi:hypothetical protein
LAVLGYLPVSFESAVTLDAHQEASVVEGSFVWRWGSTAASLDVLWNPGVDNVITRGAVMSFESAHHLATDGVAGTQVWAALESDLANGVMGGAYNYVVVSTALPEKATVFSNGAAVYSSLVNTGVAQAPTELGTWPVYLRYTTTTMSGTNPDGSHYSDPGIPWVSYFHGGDALHGFIRPGYGWPQSVGCVELPIANAGVVWPLTPIGTLVSVT